MERFSGETRTDDEGGPRWILFKKCAKGFEEKGEVFLIGVPSTNGDDLILFLNGGVELKDIGLDGVRNTVNLFWVGLQADGEGLPKEGGRGSFDKDAGQKPKSFS